MLRRVYLSVGIRARVCVCVCVCVMLVHEVHEKDPDDIHTVEEVAWRHHSRLHVTCGQWRPFCQSPGCCRTCPLLQPVPRPWNGFTDRSMMLAITLLDRSPLRPAFLARLNQYLNRQHRPLHRGFRPLPASPPPCLEGLDSVSVHQHLQNSINN